MAVPTWGRSAYRSGTSDMVVLQIPTRSRSRRSQMSAVAAEVAMILGAESIASTLAAAASTAAFSCGSVICSRLLAVCSSPAESSVSSDDSFASPSGS